MVFKEFNEANKNEGFFSWFALDLKSRIFQKSLNLKKKARFYQYWCLSFS